MWLSERCRANTAHISQSRPDSGLDFQVTGLKNLFPLRSEADEPSPQKALRGVIPGDGFGIWGRVWSHFEGNSRPKITNLSIIDF